MRFGIQQDAFLQALGYMLWGFPIFHLLHIFSKAQEKSRGTAESRGRKVTRLSSDPHNTAGRTLIRCATHRWHRYSGEISIIYAKYTETFAVM